MYLASFCPSASRRAMLVVPPKTRSRRRSGHSRQPGRCGAAGSVPAPPRTPCRASFFAGGIHAAQLNRSCPALPAATGTLRSGRVICRPCVSGMDFGAYLGSQNCHGHRHRVPAAARVTETCCSAVASLGQPQVDQLRAWQSTAPSALSAASRGTIGGPRAIAHQVSARSAHHTATTHVSHNLNTHNGDQPRQNCCCAQRPGALPSSRRRRTRPSRVPQVPVY